MKTFKDLLIELRACEEARNWASEMSIEEVVKLCHRGDWLLWLSGKIDIDIRLLTLTKGYCVKTILHLMKDERSVNAVYAAIKFGNGEIEISELKAAYAAADAAAAAAAAAAADAAAAAAYADAAAAAAAAADAAAAAAYAASAAYTTARNKNLNETADICRKYLGEIIVKKVNELLKNV